MLQIKQQFINKNYTPNGIKKIKYIVIHDTANYNIGADADAHYKYFNADWRDASAHYFVDDTQILQIVRLTDKAWHIGTCKDGICNDVSIGVEMCMNKDGNYNKVYQNTIDLVVYLKQQYPDAQIVRHYDGSSYGKICPEHMSDNNWAKWYKFLDDVDQQLNATVNADWKVKSIQKLLDAGILTDENWLNKADEYAPVWMVCAVADRILEVINCK